MEEPVENTELWKVLDKTIGWVAHADAKVPPALALGTAMLGSLAAFAPPTSGWTSLWLVVAFGLAFVLTSVALGRLLFAILPRTDGPKDSLVFFGAIAELSRSEFAGRVHSRTVGEWSDDLAAQIHVNASIANQKYHHIRAAYALLFAAFLPWCAALYLMFGAASAG